jgi:hypothetical protein
MDRRIDIGLYGSNLLSGKYAFSYLDLRGAGLAQMLG